MGDQPALTDLGANPEDILPLSCVCVPGVGLAVRTQASGRRGRGDRRSGGTVLFFTKRTRAQAGETGPDAVLAALPDRDAGR